MAFHIIFLGQQTNMNLNAGNVHMYGHGVGAHIAGVCASEVTGIGIITGEEKNLF